MRTGPAMGSPGERGAWYRTNIARREVHETGEHRLPRANELWLLPGNHEVAIATSRYAEQAETDPAPATTWARDIVELNFDV